MTYIPTKPRPLHEVKAPENWIELFKSLPPQCDFCGEIPAVYCHDSESFLDRLMNIQYMNAWAACSICHQALTHSDSPTQIFDRLMEIMRSTYRQHLDHNPGLAVFLTRQVYLFLNHRKSTWWRIPE